MYDLPCVKAATDAWCAGLSRALANEGFDGAPETLTRGEGVDALWRSPDLLLSQTCGYPLLTSYRDCLSLLLTPVYRTPGCTGGKYRSFTVVSRDSTAQSLADLRGSRCAINGATSQSGMNVLRREIAPLARDGRFFSEIVVSGRHPESIALIVAGEADVAAIDCVTFGLMAKHAPDTVSAVRVLGETRAAPSLPYVTTSDATAECQARIKAALRNAVVDPDLASVREVLLIDGFTELSLSEYEIMTDMEAEAAAMGYPALA
ncbi:MAG: PhnD/SsuA/transferrin family substrate-binding protein [Rhodospirillaceae bacterium]|nr:PhnD/SsuA/transferrin family substrate-binding protein [Rhodospirillaceae bacterium]MDD9926874.1 PhnD/SsuA/transferrin family substrate-binding protein [Rhodospirillaceae bacterium]